MESQDAAAHLFEFLQDRLFNAAFLEIDARRVDHIRDDLRIDASDILVRHGVCRPKMLAGFEEWVSVEYRRLGWRPARGGKDALLETRDLIAAASLYVPTTAKCEEPAKCAGRV